MKRLILDKIYSILFKFHGSKFSNLSTSLFIENIFAILRRKKVRFYFDNYSKKIVAKESTFNKYGVTKNRFFSLYRDGIKVRGKRIHNSYCLENIKFELNDVIVDCGANNGDLLVELSNLVDVKKYIAIEPNPEDFSCLKLSCPDSLLINKALAEKDDTLKFYVSTSSGDSSLIMPETFEEIIEVQTIKFSELLNKYSIKKVKLFKVEAEGYEPEVLQGALDCINLVEYISIDGGYERGPKKDQTFTEITNLLLKNNFEICDINFTWCRGLFHNRNFS